MNQPGLGRIEKLSYGLADLAGNLSWNFISGFLLLYLVNVALIPAAVVGTLILVSMVLSAFLDPAIGVIVDRTKTRYGKARPYLLYCAVPLGLLTFALFISPFHSMAGKVVFAYVALILLEVVFGIVSITTGALIPLMTRQPHEKMQLSSIRTFGGSVGTFVVTGLTMPIVSLFGDNLQRGLGYAAAIFASMISLSLLVVFKNCKERYGTPLPPQNGALGNAFHNLLRNRTWQVTNAFALLTLLRLGALIASTAFFCIQVLHQPKMISILLPLLSVASLCAAPLAPAYFRKTGIRFGIIVLLASSIGLFGIMPFLEGRVWVFLSAYTLAQAFSVGPSATAAFAMAANSVDHQQWLHGARSEGLVFASLSVAVKVGIAIGTSLTGYALAWAGFDALHPSNSAAGAIRAVYYGVPMVVMAMQIVCISFYNMDRIHPQIVADLNARSKMALAFPDPENTGAAV